MPSVLAACPAPTTTASPTGPTTARPTAPATAPQTAPTTAPEPDTSWDSLPAALLRLADTDTDAVADELHDGALQALVVARYAADAVVRGADPELVRTAVQDALVTLRRTVWQLRPRAAVGLSAALSDLSTQRVAAGLPPLDLDLEPGAADGLPRIPAGVAYRLVQAVLGAATDSVRVRLARTSRGVVLDCAGTVPDTSAWSLRAQAVGGELVVAHGRLRLLLPNARRDREAGL